MTMLEIIKIVAFALVFIVSTGIPLGIKLVTSVKAYRTATTEAEKEKAYNDMFATAQSFIAAAEESFKGFDAVMKQQGSTAGAMKKDTVFNKLQAYALSQGYEFDAEFWSTKIDEIVKFTREVNAQIRK